MIVKKTTTADKNKLNYCTMQLATKCANKEGMLSMSEFYTATSPFYINGRYSICLLYTSPSPRDTR